MIWTEERIAVLRRLRAEGLSAGQIASQMDGVSRNAVIGKLHRMNRPEEGGPATGRPGKAKPAATPQPAAIDGQGPAPARSAALAVLAEEPGLATFSTLEAHMCRWPIGDPMADDFSFCGQALALGRPYCAQHARAAYRPAPGAAPGRVGADINRMIARYA